MHALRKRRLYTACSIIIGVAVAVALCLYAIRQQVDLYYTPQQLTTAHILPEQEIRIGGMVKLGSLTREKNSLKIHFVITDYQRSILVSYQGLLPALFREGRGIVVRGHINRLGWFDANQVLAKHDERYKPPDVG